MLTMPQVMTLMQKQWLYDASTLNADGTPKRWLVTSLKTWKTRPDDWELRLKHGLKTFERVGPNDIAWPYILCRVEAEATDQRRRVERYYGNPNNPVHHMMYFQNTHLGHIDSKHEVTLEELTEMQMDIADVEAVGFMVDETANRIWVCIDGVNVLRVKGIKEFSIEDNRRRKYKKKKA